MYADIHDEDIVVLCCACCQVTSLDWSVSGCGCTLMLRWSDQQTPSSPDAIPHSSCGRAWNQSVH